MMFADTHHTPIKLPVKGLIVCGGLGSEEAFVRLTALLSTGRHLWVDSNVNASSGG